MSSSGFAALCSAFGRYDVVHIHAEGPAFFAWLPKLLGKRVVVTIHGECAVPIPQCEESENIPLPDLSEQPENVQRPGSEVVEKGMLT